MDIFSWIKDIEETYESLINKTDVEIENEIKELEIQEQNKMEAILNQKNKFLNDISERLKKDIHTEVLNFDQKMNQEIEKMNQEFSNNKNKIIKEILTELGFDF
ncbi:MAG: hypothetical protein JXA99_10915 [Candidatus Lokiarchaeota archaeon]|nr:hypothetical protein [Candidatus Lokiarchaeota archaeon]